MSLDPQNGGRGDARTGVVDDIRIVAGDGVCEAGPCRRSHVPAKHHISGPDLPGEAQAATYVGRDQLEEVHVDLQGGGAVDGEPEPVQDASSVYELG